MGNAPGPLRRLREIGQSPWCDELSRELIQNGKMGTLVKELGIRGVTSNPAIFQKALSSSCYDEQVTQLAITSVSAKSAYEELAITDVRAVADLLMPVYQRSGGTDGFVSLEVSPEIAHDSKATVAEALRLASAVGRPNVMIKIPATDAGLDAISLLLAEGVNVNVTLIFGLARYAQVLEAWLKGVSGACARGLAVDRIASVASFFVSRIDTAVDALIDQELASGNTNHSCDLSLLKGKTAIACARLAYCLWREFVAQKQVKRVMSRGARVQRLLWASTSTKNPAYRDVLYVEELVGPNTVTTMPMTTIEALLDHGSIRGATLLEGVETAKSQLAALEKIGINLDRVANELETKGLELFKQAFETLVREMGERVKRLKPILHKPQKVSAAKKLRPILVGIGGDSGSGKSTLLPAFYEMFGSERITGICLDDYHSLDRRQRSLVGLTALDPRANNFALMEEQILALKRGLPIKKPVYDHRDGTFREPEIVEPREVVIVQGLHPFLVPAIRHAFDLKVWLDPEEELRVEWKIQRDVAKRGYSRQEVLAELEARRPDVEAYIKPQRKYADMVVRFFRADSSVTDMRHLSVRIVQRHSLPQLSFDRQINDSKCVRLYLDVVDEDGLRADVIEIDGSVSAEEARLIEDNIWAHIEGKHGDVHRVPPEKLGSYEEKARRRRHSDPLALAQLILSHRILSARQSVLLRVLTEDYETDFAEHQHVA